MAALLAVAAAPAPAAAQDTGAAGGQAGSGQSPETQFHASPYLPLGHWAYDVLEQWIAVGRVETLSPLTRPWRRMDVARALLQVQRSRPHAHEQGWLSRLRGEFRPELERLEGRRDVPPGEIRGRVAAGTAGWSQTHRDFLRPELEGEFSDAEVLERAHLHVDAHAGPVAGGFRAARDGFFAHDAQFPDGRVVPPRGLDVLGLDELRLRVEEAYAELQTRYARVSFGRMDRDWGLPGLPGYTRSDYSYAFNEAAYRFGSDDVFLTGTFAALGDVEGDTTRYLSTHRLEVRPADELVLAVSEAALHGGPSEPLDFAFVNPLGIWHLSDRGEGTTESSTPVNFVGQVDLWWRPVQGLALYGSLLADATNSPAGEDTSCCQMGGSLGLELPGLVRGWRFRLQASSVQSLAYRTRRPWEEWSVSGLGLGWDKADLHLFTAEAQWLGHPGLVLRPRVDVQALGESSEFAGNLRPPSDQLPDFPRVLAGEAELTVRPSVSGRWRPAGLGGWGLDVTWDVGVNVVQDFRHVAGDDRVEPVGRVGVMLESPPVRLPID